MNILDIQVQAAVLMSFQKPSQSCIQNVWFLFALLRVRTASNTDGICCLLYPAAAAVAGFCPPVCPHLLIETDKSLTGAFSVPIQSGTHFSHLCPALTLSSNITNPQQLESWFSPRQKQSLITAVGRKCLYSCGGCNIGTPLFDWTTSPVWRANFHAGFLCYETASIDIYSDTFERRHRRSLWQNLRLHDLIITTIVAAPPLPRRCTQNT